MTVPTAASYKTEILSTNLWKALSGQLTSPVLGLVLAHAHARQLLREGEAAVDYLAVHKLSEFPPYKRARTSRDDEPLFARGILPGDVVTFQGKRYIVRKAVARRAVDDGDLGIECGDDYFVTLVGGIRDISVSSSLLTFVAKGQPSVKKQRQKRYKPDVEPTAVEWDEKWIAPWMEKRACELPKPEVRFHQVTPEDVYWATKQQAFSHPRPMSASTLANFFEKHRLRREAQYENERRLQALAHSLGDEWASTHPEMEVSLSYFAPKKLMTIFHAKAESCGGRRVSTHRPIEENVDYSDGGDSSSDKSVNDCRASAVTGKKRPERYVPPATANCLQCGGVFTARKGTKFCPTKDCRQRHHELNAA